MFLIVVFVLSYVSKTSIYFRTDDQKQKLRVGPVIEFLIMSTFTQSNYLHGKDFVFKEI